METQRPVNLDLTTIRFPITAIISILHRIAGVFLFLMIPYVLWLAQTSLASVTGFVDLASMLSGFWAKLIFWVFLSALIYHLVAGIRHLCLDLGWGETRSGGKMGAQIVLWTSIILAILVGIYLW